MNTNPNQKFRFTYETTLAKFISLSAANRKPQAKGDRPQMPSLACSHGLTSGTLKGALVFSPINQWAFQQWNNMIVATTEVVVR